MTTQESFPLSELIDEVIELCVSLPGIGHITIAGRVRYVPASPACWIGEACLPPTLQVERDTTKSGQVYKTYEYVLRYAKLDPSYC